MHKRRHPRIAPLVLRTVVTLDGDGDRRETYLTSLSEGGAFLAGAEAIPVGARISLRLTLPRQLGDIEVRADVVYTLSGDEETTAGVGIAFVELRPEDQERIRSYVERFRDVAAQLVSTDPR